MILLGGIFCIFALAVVAPFLHRLTGRATGWILAVLPAVIFAALLTVTPSIWNGGIITASYEWAPDIGLALSFQLDGLSLLFSLLITGIGALILIYAGGYLERSPERGRFFALLLFFMGSMLGLVLAANLLLLYLFWEFTSVSSYLLIGFEHHRAEARSAALKAFLVTFLGGLGLFVGIIMLYLIAGTFELPALMAIAESIRNEDSYNAIVLLILLAAFTKSAQFPFHFWLPAAMEAPTPVSAYLHSATMVKAGVYLVARLSPLLGGTDLWYKVLTTVGVVTMVAGAFLALWKTDLKQILAYATISVLGMLTMLVGIGTPLALEAMCAYVLAHAMYKGALFLVAGGVDHSAGTRDAASLGGLRASMPLTALIALVAALSMAGFPPLFGFIGKEVVYEAARVAPRYAGLLTAAAAFTGAILFTLAAIVGFRPFVGPKTQAVRHAHESGPSLLAGPALLAAAGLSFGVFPALIKPMITSATAAIAPGHEIHATFALFHGFTPALWLSIAGVLAGLLIYAIHEPVRAYPFRLRFLGRFGPDRIYEWSFNSLYRAAAAQTRLLQNGLLRYYILITVGATVVLTGFTFIRRAGVPKFSMAPGVEWYDVGLLIMILASSIVAAVTSSGLISVIALGVVGLGMALLFVLFGAPDLAMTQFAVEALAVILLLLVFYNLPEFSRLAKRASKFRDGVFSVIGGALISLLVLAVTSEQYDRSVSSYYLENSLTLGHGRNVVNVILTDFRGLDTMGEITVLAIAAIGVYTLIRMRLPKGEDE